MPPGFIDYRFRPNAPKTCRCLGLGRSISSAQCPALLVAFDEQYMVTVQRFQGRSSDYIPFIVLLAGPLCTVFILTYLFAVSRKQLRLAVILVITVIASVAYVLLIYPQLGIRPFRSNTST